jgi:hypothetical protein
MSSADYRRFQRNFIPGTIGLQPEDEHDHYKRLQQQPVDTSNCLTVGSFSYDHENGIEMYTSYIDQTVTTTYYDGRKTVTPLIPT